MTLNILLGVVITTQSLSLERVLRFQGMEHRIVGLANLREPGNKTLCLEGGRRGQWKKPSPGHSFAHSKSELQSHL